MSDQVWWYATRAAGLMTWSTACASVIVGLLLSARAIKARTGPWMLDLHRFLGAVSVIFLLTHLGTLWADSYVEFGWRELLIPGESTWEPEAAAWGIIAAYALIAVQLTSMLRRWISTKVWRAVHLTSIITVAAGTYHAMLGGSDVDNPLTWVVAGVGTLLVTALIGVRLRRAAIEDPEPNKLSDREQLLHEMRSRLESLPVAENTAQPELELENSPMLPRRSPVRDAPDHDPASPDILESTEPPSHEAPAQAPDPFNAVPLSDGAPDLGSWVTPSEADPFGREPIDPFRKNGGNSLEDLDISMTGRAAPDPFLRPRPFTDPSSESEPAALDDGPAVPFPESPFGSEAPPAPSPFGNEARSAPSPFGNESSTPFADAPPLEPLATPTPAPAPAPTPEKESNGSSPFGTSPSPTADAELFSPATPHELDTGSGDFPELPDLAESRPAFTPAGPPPLPETAVDPSTGEPDQTAYTAWLVEWLAYAEQYGEETPEDPSRA